MDISKLDEYQGLEAQMVRDWMTRKGCSVLNGYWRHPTEKYTYPDGKYGGLLWANTLNLLSADFGFGSVQALLRKINPRMRKGMPSEAARNAHDGFWLMRMEYTPPTTVRWENYRKTWRAQQTNCKDEIEAEDAKHCLFWPCDAEGNKVRWPTDAEGNML